MPKPKPTTLRKLPTTQPQRQYVFGCKRCSRKFPNGILLGLHYAKLPTHRPKGSPTPNRVVAKFCGHCGHRHPKANHRYCVHCGTVRH